MGERVRAVDIVGHRLRIEHPAHPRVIDAVEFAVGNAGREQRLEVLARRLHGAPRVDHRAAADRGRAGHFDPVGHHDLHEPGHAVDRRLRDPWPDHRVLEPEHGTRRVQFGAEHSFGWAIAVTLPAFQDQRADPGLAQPQRGHRAAEPGPDDDGPPSAHVAVGECRRIADDRGGGGRDTTTNRESE